MTGRLHSPALSILDVALAVGFAGPAALSSAFRRWTGLSPREWRSRPVMASVGAGWCRTRSDGDLRTPVSPPVRGYESGGSDSHPTPSHPGFALARTILQVELTRLGQDPRPGPAAVLLRDLLRVLVSNPGESLIQARPAVHPRRVGRLPQNSNDAAMRPLEAAVRGQSVDH
jgi:hypothetical protein